jgi:hypothetical protein
LHLAAAAAAGGLAPALVGLLLLLLLLVLLPMGWQSLVPHMLLLQVLQGCPLHQLQPY